MVKVNPDILVWARLKAKLSIEEAASKLGLHDSESVSAKDRLIRMEKGDELPSRSLLVKMSEKYRRSLLAFYLSKRPKDGDRGEDYRTSSDISTVKNDSIVDVLVRDIWVRQGILRSAMEDEEEAKPLKFVGSINMSYQKSKVVNVIYETLRFDVKKFYAFSGTQRTQKAFSYLRKLCEEAGVFVLLMSDLGSYHTKIDSKTFRGFALADKICPFIVINNQDAKAAYAFTLLHEFVHILLGKSGISGKSIDKEIEKYCNEIASEALLPVQELSSLVIANDSDLAGIVKQINEFSTSHNLSASMVAYRLYAKKQISYDLWNRLSEFFYQGWLKGQKSNSAESKPIPYYKVKRSNLGDSLVSVVQRMMQSGSLTTMRAGKVLDVNAINVHKLFVH